jgi:hypothetical protein
MAAGATIPHAHPHEGMGHNAIMIRGARLRHDGVTERGVRDEARCTGTRRDDHSMMQDLDDGCRRAPTDRIDSPH